MKPDHLQAVSCTDLTVHTMAVFVELCGDGHVVQVRKT